MERTEDFKQRLAKLIVPPLCALCEGSRLTPFAGKNWSPSEIGGVTQGQVDKAFFSYARFRQEVDTYKTLKYAVK